MSISCGPTPRRRAAGDGAARPRGAGTRVPKKLSATTFDDFWKAQDPFSSEPCELDLRGVELITPAALVHLAAGCHALARTNRYPTILVDDFMVRSYLQRVCLTEVVAPVARFDPPYSRVFSQGFDNLRGKNDLLIEVTKVQTGGALPALLDRIVAVLTDHLDYPKNDAFDAAIAVSEVAQNTFDHNRDADTCGFLAMQTYSGPEGPFLEIGIADDGDGLRATLARNEKNPPIHNDGKAIEVATELGTSEHDDATRGTGLYHLLEIAYKHEGSAQIRSGTAVVRYRFDRKKGWGFTVAHMPGVQVALTLRAKNSP